jgi:hypothetical protein
MEKIFAAKFLFIDAVKWSGCGAAGVRYDVGVGSPHHVGVREGFG